MTTRRQAILAALLILGTTSASASGPDVIIGSKKFTESVILGEIGRQLVESTGVRAEHRRELGGTRILFGALERGQIDVYPEYTGTIVQEILIGADHGDLARQLAARGVRMTEPLGFNNTYAIGMRSETADRLGIRTISDLRRHPDLRLGFTNEFMERGDGWPALRARYALPQTLVTGLDHDLALRALSDGNIDATDLYSTDAEIAYYHFRMIEDDLAFFPRYDAVFLYRADLETSAPEVVTALRRLAGTIDEPDMIAMNRQVKIDRQSESAVAAAFLSRSIGVETALPAEETLPARQLRLLVEHLHMVIVSLAFAILVSIPLGVVAAKYARTGQVVLGVVAVIQTIPALALLVLLMPLPWPREAGRPNVLGVGTETAIIALFLYSLLPIVRNTYTALKSIDLSIRESADALGLSPWAKLSRIELPLASRTIVAGIKTAAVINIGFATLGALIGAGGYGQPILTGIRRDDFGLILEGAVPAAVLALLVVVGFDLAERLIVPKGLRLRPAA